MDFNDSECCALSYFHLFVRDYLTQKGVSAIRPDADFLLLCVDSGATRTRKRPLTATAAPVWDTLDLNTVVKQTDGSLFEWPHASRWRDGSRPNKTVDDAWYEFEEFRTFPITAEDVRKLGKDPELAVKYPVDYGYGDDAYVAELDIFHQIHCLNLLRQTAWVEFDRNESHGKRPYSEVHWIHLSHCTDILLQNIMCTGNLDVVTFNWMESQTLPFPDFFVNHQCRDFDQIVKWNLEHTVPVKQTRNFTRPKSGYKEVPISKEFYRIYGFDEEEVHASFAHAQGGH